MPAPSPASSSASGRGRESLTRAARWARTQRRLRALWRHPRFREGVAATAPISVGIAAWGLVTGIAMIDAGLGWPLSLLATLTVYAGTAQLATLPLIMSGAPLGLIVGTAICVNLRFVIFSAAWRPYLMHLPLRGRVMVGYFNGDLSHVLFMQRFGGQPAAPGQLPFFWGNVALNWTVWQGATILGMAAADVLPRQWGLGFAGTLAMLGLALSLMTDRSTWIASGVSATAAVATAALPLKLNLVVAIAAAVAIGLVMDQRRARRAAGGER